jgi:pSer/pThr/pTyr-binding forkhead associated (FHA) protein
VVNAAQRTSAPNVYAAGDVAEVAGGILGLWEPAQRQAKVAAANMLGQATSYEPGCHYLATRLFDLDFASVGKTGGQSHAGSGVVVDFPQGTGKIAYRKLVFDGPRLTGALMLGQREERVRVHGRLFKRLIDSKVDVGAVASKLLDRSFDLRAWVAGQVVPAPSAAAAGEFRGAPAAGGFSHIKRTQAIRMSTLSPGAGDMAGPPRTAAALLGTQVLSSFNLRPDAASPGAVARTPAPGAGGAAARTSLLASRPPREPVILEVSDRRVLSFTSDLIAMGRGSENDVVLRDPTVDFAHAHIQRYADDYYLRDLGSRGGTWVNEQAVIVPHRLRSGDRLRLGATEIVLRSAEPARPSAVAETKAPEVGSANVPPRLEVRSGQALGVSFALAKSPCSIGSDPAADVFLSDYSVLPRHAELHRDAVGWVLRPGAAGAATAHRGRWLMAEQAVVLEDGDALQLGAVELRFSKGLSPEAARWASRGPAPAQASAAGAAPRPPATSEQRVQLLPAAPNMWATSAATTRYVRVLQGPGAGQRYAVGEWLAVGSAPGPAGLALRDPSLFPTELELRAHEGRLFARSVAVAGRSFHNGAPLGDRYAVCNAGDRFQLGPHVVLAIEDGP